MQASGAGVFETLKVVDGRPFALTRHLRRLASSAHALGLPAVDDAAVRRAVQGALAHEPPPLSRLRILWGVGQVATEPVLQVEVTELPVPAPSISVVTSPWPRTAGSPVVSHKSTAYAENLVALSYALERGAGEALVADADGRLCEGTGTNVFVVTGGEVLTPSLATGCLPGITRELVLEWTSARETDMTVEDAKTADEVFVVSSTRDVQGVARWDDVVWDAPGDVTTQVAEIFAQRALEEDP